MLEHLELEKYTEVPIKGHRQKTVRQATQEDTEMGTRGGRKTGNKDKERKREKHISKTKEVEKGEKLV